MTNAAGAVVWSAAYTPFGEAQVDQGSTVVNNFRFPGQYYDEESGLHYNWHRYYDPKTGRYLSADPLNIASTGLHFKKPGYDYETPTLDELLENPLTQYPYVYGINNPVNNIDPTGEVAITATTIGIITGLVALAPLAYYGYQCLKWWGKCFDKVLDYRKKCPDAFPQDIWEYQQKQEECKKTKHYCKHFAFSSYTF